MKLQLVYLSLPCTEERSDGTTVRHEAGCAELEAPNVWRLRRQEIPYRMASEAEAAAYFAAKTRTERVTEKAAKTAANEHPTNTP